jgi:hypothetical protein
MNTFKKNIIKFYLQNFYECPNEKVRVKLLKKWSDLESKQNINNKMEYHAKHLCEQGYTFIPSYFKANILEDLKSDFERFINDKKWDEFKNIQFSREVLSSSVAFSQAAVDPFLMELIEYYIGKTIFLAELQGRRSERFVTPDYGNQMWHHDTKRKQVKIFIYLTEVLHNGQHMDILPKTHNIWHEFSQYEDTRYDQDRIKEYFDKYGKPFNFLGPAGSVCIFDTNALHRGNRNGPRRDILVFNYTAGRSLYPIPKPHPNASKHYSPKQKEIARLSGKFSIYQKIHTKGNRSNLLK